MAPALTVIMPVYDEQTTVEAAIARVVEDCPCPFELLVVDDGSTDASHAGIARHAARDPRIRVFRHPRNRGKGAAVRTALAHAVGALTVVQDSDLEYDPRDLVRLLRALDDPRVDVAVGNRFAHGAPAAPYPGHAIANRLLTLAHNVVTGDRLGDLHCCYKVYRTPVLRRLGIREDRFGVDAELMAKVATQRLTIAQVPVSYRPRRYADGKKVGVRDAVRSVWCAVRYGGTARFRGR
ncbi:MAG: glycosyltransferase family 2 protein [Sandaracinaceae bacterium]